MTRALVNDDCCTACGGHLDTDGHVKGCGNDSIVTRLIPPAPGETLSAAEYLYEIGEVNAVEMLRFMEKPHAFPELVALWDDELTRMCESKVRAL